MKLLILFSLQAAVVIPPAVAPAASPTPTEVDVATAPTAPADWHRAKTVPDAVAAVCMDAATLPAATPADVNPATPKVGTIANGATTAVTEPMMNAFVTVELSCHLFPAASAVVLMVPPIFFDSFTINDFRFCPFSKMFDSMSPYTEPDAIIMQWSKIDHLGHMSRRYWIFLRLLSPENLRTARLGNLWRGRSCTFETVYLLPVRKDVR